MHATLHAITARVKEQEMFYTRLSDFEVAEGRPVPVSTALEPGWAPYCVDPESRALVFLHIDPALDLADAAFTYVMQYREADCILTVPLEALDGLTADLPMPPVIWIFSTGRCGSTLLSHVLNGSEKVWSLSEPSAFDEPSLAVPEPDALPGLIAHVTKLLFACRPDKRRDTIALKLRSQGLFRAAAFHRATPGGRFLFMYRDAIGWTASFYQFLQAIESPPLFDREGRDFVWNMIGGGTPLAYLDRYMDRDDLPVHMDRIFPAGWARHLEAYLSCLDAGVPFMALRYNEFAKEREALTQRLFAHCGLPAAGLARALEAFEKDSQEGTPAGRDETRLRLGEENLANIRATLAKNARFTDPDTILPDVYSEGRGAGQTP